MSADRHLEVKFVAKSRPNYVELISVSVHVPNLVKNLTITLRTIELLRFEEFNLFFYLNF